MPTRFVLLLASVLAACASSAPASDAPRPATPAALDAAIRQVDAGTLWPGFDPAGVPLAVYDGTTTWLFRHPSPPDGFSSNDAGAWLYSGRHHAVIANTSAEIGGVATATLLLIDPDAPLKRWTGIAAHEAFHVFQREHHPGWQADEGALFTYPTDDTDLLALRRQETVALGRALADSNGDCWSRGALAIRAERFARLDAASAAYERGTELNEGLARYVEARASGEPLGALPAGYPAADVRRRAYDTGAALAVLLDRTAPGWQDAFQTQEGATLDGTLRDALGAGPTCEGSQAERDALTQTARTDVSGLVQARQARRDTFDVRPGWRLVVEATADAPLWPQGFDPLNVDPLGGADVLHTRFLRLGDDTRHVEILGGDGTTLDALTTGVGPHPLFQGVRRLVVAGLAEPTVERSADTVTVRAPGLDASFADVEVVRQGHTITVRPRPLPPLDSSPYATLRAAYVARDAPLAASAYTPDARLGYNDGSAETTAYEGRDAIRASFQSFFDRVHPAHTLDLDFRLVDRRARGGAVEERGLYRLRAGRASTGYGRFEVVLDPASGLFQSDISHPATLADFEEAPGPILLAPDEEDLDPAYYDALAGRYRQPDGCDLVVTSSAVRLFVRDTCTQSWRGLTRVSGRTWTAGDRVLSDSAFVTIQFAALDSLGIPPSLTVGEEGGAVQADRATPYRTAPLSFSAPDGALLAGTLYLPHTPGPHPAVALVHGSGPQDRRGYASIIAVLADALAAQGVAVLAYDKRGVRDSEGEGGSFAVLGADARAALDALRRRPEVDPARVGLAGSSQAGWVIAKAIERGADPAAVFLLGAAGAALDVPEQNLYNTRVRMECESLDPDDVRLALGQQRAFFDYVLDPTPDTAGRLDGFTAAGRERPALADWLFPSSAETDLDAPAWFTTLELDFDPLPVWAAYDGVATFVFAEHDDATPTRLAVGRLAAAPQATVIVLDGAQHLGLTAASRCLGDLADAAAFHPGLFGALAQFARRLGTP